MFMKIAGIHLERLKAVIRKEGTDIGTNLSILNFSSLEEMFESKELLGCDSLYINAGENNYLIKSEFFPDKNPDEVTQFILKNLNKYIVGRRKKEEIIRIATSPAKKGCMGYIIESEKKRINQRIQALPIDDYRISGVIPDNLAVVVPFILHQEGTEHSILIVEIVVSEFIFTCLDKGVITFARSSSFEEKDLLDSLDEGINIASRWVDKIERIYITGDLSEKEKKKLYKKSAYRKKFIEYSLEEMPPPDSLLAYGLSLTPEMGMEVDLTPEEFFERRKDYKEERRIKGYVKRIGYLLGGLLFIPILLLVAEGVWLLTFNQRIERYRELYQTTKELQSEVVELQMRIQLQESTRTSIPWERFLNGISKIIPRNVRLASLESEPVIMKDKKGFKIHLAGKGKNQEAVMKFYTRLKDMKVVRETNIEKVENKGGITIFEFTATLVPADEHQF